MNKAIISLLVVTGACSGDGAFDPGSGDDPGTGTGSLVVEGNVRASATFDNASAASDFVTEVSVRVSLGDQAVTTGDVTITSATGTTALAFVATGEDAGHWRGSLPGYDEVYALDVISGEDSVTGVRVDGPDIHIFTAPTAGATVDSTMPLAIAWSSDDAADEASIRADRIDSLGIADTGSFELAAGALEAKSDRAETNTLRITRANRVTPAGAAAGSRLEVTVENTIEVLAQPDPTR